MFPTWPRCVNDFGPSILLISTFDSLWLLLKKLVAQKMHLISYLETSMIILWPTLYFSIVETLLFYLGIWGIKYKWKWMHVVVKIDDLSIHGPQCSIEDVWIKELYLLGQSEDLSPIPLLLAKSFELFPQVWPLCPTLASATPWLQPHTVSLQFLVAFPPSPASALEGSCHVSVSSTGRKRNRKHAPLLIWGYSPICFNKINK